ncbi:MAG: tRNA (adenosine(37)-N6)-threonylcarbamoyltransferase complex ATPase subunit type 1 TsaE [Chitinophagaceae bacterium]|nr:MAG: tRNA (adenosine(37)-N6)-threonylcarbamoyltransferase complex ATPase subunit type 1 TsaE [Chitinophagaceae bacterium]
MVVLERQYGLSDLPTLAAELIAVAAGIKVWAFEGEMGAGKTTLISELCKQLGVTDPVSSPTFAIINEYAYLLEGLNSSLFHIDLYRMEDEDEARRAGIEECLFSGKRCFVEWPQRVPSIFPDEFIKIRLDYDGEASRTIRVASIKND